MNFSILFAKLKAFLPVVAVWSVVAITVNLLKTKTPISENSLNVSAEEDIQTTSYEDQIVMPEPEPEPAPEEEEKGESEEEPQETEDSSEEVDEEEEAEEPKEEKQEQKKEEKSDAPKRKFINGGMGALLGRILNPKKKG